MELETQTELAMRRLNIVYHDASSMLNRTSIKRWLSELEKTVSKAVPDFVVIKGCCRYILFELHRKEWCKYYFLSVTYEPNKPITRSHLVLSRYPFIHNDNFGTNHLVQIKIPFNDVPMRYEYEDLDVQQIDNDTITLLITELDSSDSDAVTVFRSGVQNVYSVPNPPTMILFGCGEYNTSQTDVEWNDCGGHPDVRYASQAWKCVGSDERTGILDFEMVNFD